MMGYQTVIVHIKRRSLRGCRVSLLLLRVRIDAIHLDDGRALGQISGYDNLAYQSTKCI